MYLQWNSNKHFLGKERIAHGTMEIAPKVLREYKKIKRSMLLQTRSDSMRFMKLWASKYHGNRGMKQEDM
jgi:hypothetical protein